MSIETILLIVVILSGFGLMTARKLSQEVAVPLVAFIAIILAGPDEGLRSLEGGFKEFAKVGLLFTAVAIPAYMLQESNLFNLLGTRIGAMIGSLNLKFKVDIILLVSFISVFTTYVMAALFHNTTSILVNSYIIYVLAKAYKLPAVFMLSAALVASNLGGFSTRWGDTPNIIESRVWGLTHMDFFKEILPVNILLVFILAFVAYFLTKRMVGNNHNVSRIKLAHSMIKFKTEGRFMSVDNKLVTFGITALLIAVVGPLFFPLYEVPLSAVGIIVALLGTPNAGRTKTLYALGIETYFTLISIFVLAQVFGHSAIGIGKLIESFLQTNTSNIYSVLALSYLGTLSTEAASWASATAPLIFKLFPTHLGAWALGAGICAGSSALITAASAGIILAHQTSTFEKDSRVDFATYIKFGIPFSLFMLLFYAIVLPLYIRLF
ncbi:MAG: hypothetical protein A2860_04185 [Candidatus Levybacteria bacterium RIFCSPHIGHO2_01_FULL_37_33]|uniref:Citrate transporter-like domain-containing protein n=1 Tax=Candidatus Blackburnbacteria bacterium RIFCSPLOWO2_01_FULL_41_27 TaxID=1797520 RepID=A0A1G1VD46_9BACT|nr:MAG: hypothetical protein A2860_04185 [Candidatus Levybacteria bacterium RIFCSPHIGHO2_01_FULL_37_33]OGH15840.1 MAG: hypothetical protein A3C97_00575 [Candidatus Levybacteria bacterium RIFCSPHIGHO2_02_FULL_37_11]OGH30142.1 MAG: hypothetical protein A3F30_00610 [Candidatus Levybacteria bacterium RIFCSPHIGHO2_12_FULL_37_12]OGY13186.1 MAG: hypothetical protein A3A58_02040 [Candidatus Blackburnbacteria bacterium RIFCSPLOWO2_01_FULL_41_27]